jgi:hypothetical protein
LRSNAHREFSRQALSVIIHRLHEIYGPSSTLDAVFTDAAGPAVILYDQPQSHQLPALPTSSSFANFRSISPSRTPAIQPPPNQLIFTTGNQRSSATELSNASSSTLIYRHRKPQKVNRRKKYVSQRPLAFTPMLVVTFKAVRRAIPLSFLFKPSLRTPYLSIPRTIPEASDSIAFAITGNVVKLKRLFSEGSASVCESSPDGWSLLHVREGSPFISMKISADRNSERSPLWHGRSRCFPAEAWG